MADNTKDTHESPDFDFTGADWDDAGMPEAAKDSDDPFGAGAFEDDAFGGAPEPADASAGDDPFAQGVSEDPFGEADAGAFDFQDMPSPETVGQLPGDPDAEFGDLGDESFDAATFAEADGLSAGDGLFEGDAGDDQEAPAFEADESDSFGADAADDPFEDDPFAADGAEEPGYDDPYATAGEDDPFAEEPAAEAEAGAAYEEPRQERRKLPVKPLALAAAGIAAAWFAWPIVQSSLLAPDPAPAPQQQAQLPDDPPFPAALPPQQQAPAAPSAQDPLPAQDVMLPPAVAQGDEEGTAPAPVMQAPQPDPPQLMPLPPAGADEADDLAGGRGGIDAIRQAQEATAAEGIPAEVESFMAEASATLSSLADRVSAIEETLASLPPARPAAGYEPQQAAPAPATAPETAALATLVPPLKPEIIESATLKGVSRGLAWVSTGSGVVEVKPGDAIPGAGRVVALREYGGRWIVVTTDGIVVQ